MSFVTFDCLCHFRRIFYLEIFCDTYECNEWHFFLYSASKHLYIFVFMYMYFYISKCIWLLLDGQKLKFKYSKTVSIFFNSCLEVVKGGYKCLLKSFYILNTIFMWVFMIACVVRVNSLGLLISFHFRSVYFGSQW